MPADDGCHPAAPSDAWNSCSSDVGIRRHCRSRHRLPKPFCTSSTDSCSPRAGAGTCSPHGRPGSDVLRTADRGNHRWQPLEAKACQSLLHGSRTADARNRLPRHSGSVQSMTAYLPAAVAGIPSPQGDPGWKAAADNILIGTSMVVSMARFAAKGEFENFTDAEIPYTDIRLAVASIDSLLAQAPGEVLQKARKLRCRTQLNSAIDMDEMREVANSAACASGM
mmetsp:Transcript_11059/g.31290  ORF Transcript_11059/g.31290 Transcript_11059/m.31290 type:complete len:224 (-) Transcript_11059:167-838(-)